MSETLNLRKNQMFRPLKRSGKIEVGIYRFGFNGQEKDDEVKVEGNSLDFGARIYDSRLGRWLSLDPLQAKYSF
jgi:RHS repeat-associated protein